MIRDSDVGFRKLYHIEGPLCLEEAAELDYGGNDANTQAKCPLCEREYQFGQPINEIKNLAHKAYQAKQNRQLEVISLDSPIQPIKDRKEDETHWVEAKLGHTKDGRKIAIIYLGDKRRDKKVQNFVDLDNEQFRGDRADAKPYEVVAKVTAEFLNSKNTIEKK